MHRAPFTLGAAGRLAQELGHGRVGAHPSRERMAVIAIGRDHVIVFPEHADRAHGDRFLTAVLMEEPPDLVPALIHHLRPLLEPPDQHHLAEPQEGLAAVDGRLGFSLHLHHDHPAPERMGDEAEGGRTTGRIASEFLNLRAPILAPATQALPGGRRPAVPPRWLRHFPS
jgi:hypothetical protein